MFIYIFNNSFFETLKFNYVKTKKCKNNKNYCFLRVFRKFSASSAIYSEISSIKS